MKTEKSRSDARIVMPAEWEPHRGTLVAWPSNPSTWEGTLDAVRESMARLAAVISRFEPLYCALDPEDDEKEVRKRILAHGGLSRRLHFPKLKTNDCWVRDFGPNYVRFKKGDHSVETAINLWDFNSWGGKYPPFDHDRSFKRRFADWIHCPRVFEPKLVLEGGAIEVNGAGMLLTTRSCLLNPNRNPGMHEASIESILKRFLGVNEIVWLDANLSGDDTDGHIDNLARFVDLNTIVCAANSRKEDRDHEGLAGLVSQMSENRHVCKKNIKVHSVETPSPCYFGGMRLPLSYLNFYFVNGGLLVPTFEDVRDRTVLEFFRSLCPGREVVGIPSRDFLRGQGGPHCLTQQVY
jgi:agmatine deiminase